MRAFDEETIERVRVAFQKYDPDSKGHVSTHDVVNIFNEMDYCVTEHDLFSLLSEVQAEDEETDSSVIATCDHNRVNFSTFLQMLAVYIRQNEEGEVEEELVDAYIAMGGTEDLKGKIQFEKIRQLCKKFNLTVDCEAIQKRLKSNGMLDFKEFKAILSRNYLL